MSVILNFTCELINGIHARPASFLAEFCQKYSASIKVKRLDSHDFQNAKSALAIVSANILNNDNFVISVHGENESLIANEISDYILGDWKLCDSDAEKKIEQTSINYIPNIFNETEQKYIVGNSVVKGIAISTLMCLKEKKLGNDYFSKLIRLTTQEELEKFDQAQLVSSEELKAKLLSSDGHERDIIKFQLQFILDQDVKSKVYCEVYNGDTAIGAISKVVDFYVEQFRNSDSDYIKQRDVDVFDIGYRLMSNIDSEISELIKPVVDSDCILLCNTLTPGQFLSIDKSKVKGLVIANIGETSHTVILARAYGIPTLIGIDESQLAHLDGREVVLDAYLGICAFDCHDRVKYYYDSELVTYAKLDALNRQYIDSVTETKDGHRVEIAANIINAEECEIAFKNGAESIGLLRTEMMYIDSDACPNNDVILNQFNDILAHTQDRNIIIRTLDIGGDKPAKYIDFGEESNPFLGYRGIRIYQDNYEIFKGLIESILRSNHQDNLKIMAPMISCIEEVVWFVEQVNQIKSNLGINCKIEIGIMLEVPSIGYSIEECCKYVDFFSIGTNDLMQYFMATDRENQKVSHLYNKYNVGFIRFLNFVVEQIKHNDKWVGVCGELAADEKFAKLLVGMGVNELSVGCSSVAKIKRLVANLDYEQCKNLLNKVLLLSDSKEVEQEVYSQLCDGINDELVNLDNVISDISLPDKDSVIKYVIDGLFLNGVTNNKYLLEKNIWDREETYSTDIGFGFAIPHAKTTNVDKTAISICRLTNPINWGTQEVSMVIMLTIKEEPGVSENEHMRIFSVLARKIMNKEFREGLMACHSGEQIKGMMKQHLEV